MVGLRGPSGYRSTNLSNATLGATIGSASIDRDFQRLVIRRLAKADSSKSLHVLLESVAWEMMKSPDFQNTKCEHGGLNDTPMFSVTLPKVDPGYVDGDTGIANGEMKFKRLVSVTSSVGGPHVLNSPREDLQALFDKQIQKLIDLIDSQLQNIQQKFPAQQVVCSGSQAVTLRLTECVGAFGSVRWSGPLAIRTRTPS